MGNVSVCKSQLIPTAIFAIYTHFSTSHHHTETFEGGIKKLTHFSLSLLLMIDDIYSNV